MAPKEPFASATSDSGSPAASVIDDGSLKFVYEQGGNNALPSYQEASGAPVEARSPLGYKVHWVSATMLNIGMMIGTGVFSTRALPPPHIIKNLDHGLFSLTGTSIHNPLRYGIRRPVAHLLDDWLRRRRCQSGRLSGVDLVLPQSLRQRGRLPRTGVPATQVLPADDVRGAVGDPVFQQRERYR